ncbi:MAG: UDP-N-acetylmuramoyl-L-alanyl-D-glutamate--2,6-diaminopimelate ligase [Candidatus Electrothrix communis]|nr:MAG: UDP-N-acetylmuramoyl-L-alanyl-D-glutamate--2,6-diaminopimelate ligase [Candidatus Electrothrix communis]
MENPQKNNISHLLDPSEHPSHKLYVIGITGTNGKTTVAHLLGEVLTAAGCKPFVLGTLNSGNKDLSTPESLDILKFMQDHLDQGGTHFVMEVTSEGIDQERIKDIDFDLKLLTNITRDHLDYHKTFRKYEVVKLNFMNEGEAHKIYPEDFSETPVDFATQLVGDFNLLNIKAAITALRHVGISEKYISGTLSSCGPPRGRMENVEAGQKFMVLIDYAHTPDALEKALLTVKKVAKHRKGRLLLLFGCGGNRDCGKRIQMGRIAGEISDFFVITDDNPRLEESQSIMDEIVKGINPDFHDYVLIQDRKKAIEFIINKSENNDVVILAGKGHETYQVLKTETIYFDDQEEVTKAIVHRLTKEYPLQEALN